jgi:hypothetical protein
VGGRRLALLVVVCALIAVGTLETGPASEQPAPTPPAAPPGPTAPGGATAPVSCRVAWGNTRPGQWAYGFSETYEQYRRRLPRTGCRKAWTVLIYMAADYDGLPEIAYQDLAEMETPFPDPSATAASTVNADVLVELDVRQPEGVRRLHMFRAPQPPGPQEVRSPVVERRQREEIGPGQGLRDFVAWGVKSYPAERYLVVVWGHGLGWRPLAAGGEPTTWTPGGRGGGLAFDQSPPSVLDTPSLRHALEGAGRPVDVYVSHACLMQSVEVASELAPAARYIVGSEQVLGFVGLPYRSVLPRVNGTFALPAETRCAAADGACRVAELLPKVQREAFGPGDSNLETFTLSTLDSRALRDELVGAARSLSAGIVAWLDEDPLNAIDLQELLATSDPGVGARGSPGFFGAYRDFGTFLAGLSRSLVSESPATAALRRTTARARQALERAVVSAGFGTGYEGPEHEGKLGVSIWLPHDADEYRARAAFFSSSPFVRAGTGDWLARVFAAPPS